jgi:hypothetical protein
MTLISPCLYSIASLQTIERETLDLCGVRINRDDVIDTNHFQKIGDHPRHDRFPPTMPPVRAPVGH